MSQGSVTSHGVVHPRCDCRRNARMRTSWTKFNPGRRFWNCQNYGTTEACRFFAWYDQPTCNRGMQILPRVLERSDELQRALDDLQRDLGIERRKTRLAKWYRLLFILSETITVVVILVLIIVMKMYGGGGEECYA